MTRHTLGEQVYRSGLELNQEYGAEMIEKAACWFSPCLARFSLDPGLPAQRMVSASCVNENLR